MLLCCAIVSRLLSQHFFRNDFRCSPTHFTVLLRVLQYQNFNSLYTVHTKLIKKKYLNG